MVTSSNGNGNGNMVVLVGAVLGSVFLILGFIAILILWGGVDPNTILPVLLPGVLVALAFLWKSFQDRETARQIREARAEIAAQSVKVDGVAKTAAVLSTDVQDLKGAVDGMTTKLVVAEVGKAVAQEETKAAEVKAEADAALAEAQAMPAEPVPVTIIDDVVPVNITEEVRKKK